MKLTTTNTKAVNTQPRHPPVLALYLASPLPAPDTKLPEKEGQSFGESYADHLTTILKDIQDGGHLDPEQVFLGLSPANRDWLAPIQAAIPAGIAEPTIFEDEFAFLRHAGEALPEKSISRALDELEAALADWNGDQPFPESAILKQKRELRESKRILFYYRDLPLFLFPSLWPELREDLVRWLADCAYYDNQAPGEAPLLLSAAFAATLPENPGPDLVAWLNQNLNQIDAELRYLETDLAAWRLDFTLTEVSDIFRANLWAGPAAEGHRSLAASIREEGLGLRGWPAWLEVELTNSCSLSCNFCPRQFTENNYGHMSVDNFNHLLDQVTALPGRKSLCLGGLGEPLEHPQWSQCLEALGARAGEAGIDRVFLETNGRHLSVETARELYEKLGSRLSVIVNISSNEPATYEKLYGVPAENLVARLEELVNTVNKWRDSGEIPLGESPLVLQILRLKELEQNIPPFFEFWEKRGATVLLQKYNRYIDLMPERRLSDLTPLDRGFCWHLARDLFIRADGSLSFCKQDVGPQPVSSDNIFQNGNNLAALWEERARHFEADFRGERATHPACAACDEWYTFNA